MSDTQPKDSAPKLGAVAGSVEVERFVCDYADAHLYEANAPKGLCDGCPHYRHATQLTDDDNDDWCWLKEGKYADGLWHECPAWIASQNVADDPRR